MTRRRGAREVRAQPVSFDLQKHVAEAIVENVYSHTLGLAGYPPVFLGSAVAIRWKGRGLVVTADHVIRGVDDSELLFAPRPPVSLKLNDGPQDATRGRMHRLEKLRVIRRHSQKEKDVAALEVPLGLEGEKPLLRFYDLSESLTLPQPMPEHVTIIGFPDDALEQPEPGDLDFFLALADRSTAALHRADLEGLLAEKQLSPRVPTSH
jgi:hypothetical protein